MAKFVDKNGAILPASASGLSAVYPNLSQSQLNSYSQLIATFNAQPAYSSSIIKINTDKIGSYPGIEVSSITDRNTGNIQLPSNKDVNNLLASPGTQVNLESTGRLSVLNTSGYGSGGIAGQQSTLTISNPNGDSAIFRGPDAANGLLDGKPLSYSPGKETVSFPINQSGQVSSPAQAGSLAPSGSGAVPAAVSTTTTNTQTARAPIAGQPTALNPYGSGATATKNFGIDNYSGAAYDNSARAARQAQGLQAFPFGYKDGASRLNTSPVSNNNLTDITTSSNLGPAGAITGGFGPGGGGGNISSQLRAPGTSQIPLPTPSTPVGASISTLGEFGGTGPAFTGLNYSPNQTGSKLITQKLPSTVPDGRGGFLPRYEPASPPAGSTGKLINEPGTPVSSQQSAAGQGFVDGGATGTGEFGGAAANDPNSAINTYGPDIEEQQRGFTPEEIAANSEAEAVDAVDPNDPAAQEQKNEEKPAEEQQQNNNQPKGKGGGGCAGGAPASAPAVASNAAQGLGAAAPAGLQGAMAAMAGAGMPAAIQGAIGGLMGGGGLGAIQGLMSGGFGGILGQIPGMGQFSQMAGLAGGLLSGNPLQAATQMLGGIMGGGGAGALGAISSMIGGGGIQNLLGSVLNPQQLLGQFANPQAILGLMSKQIPGIGQLSQSFGGNGAGQFLNGIINQAGSGIFGKGFGLTNGNNPIPGLQNLTQTGLNSLLSVGNSKVPALFGTVPSGSSLGNNIITNIIGNTAGKAMAGTSLSGFSTVLNIADAAASILNETYGLKQQAKYLQFRTKAEQVLEEEKYIKNEAYKNLDEDVKEQIDPPDEYSDPIVVELEGSIEKTIESLFESNQVQLFGSAYTNLNDMITQGFGSLSRRPVYLGLDLIELGKMGDITDLLNLGNPCQIARQLVEKGNLSRLAIIDALTFKNLTVKDLTDSKNKNLIQTEILDKINNIDVLQDAIATLEITGDRKISTLGDLTNTKIMLPRSNIYNRFKNFEDMALILAMCGTGDIIQSLGDLGQLMSEMEVLDEDSPALDLTDLGEGLEGLDEILGNIEPLNGQFFSVVDFIGSAIGFDGFDAAIYRIGELQGIILKDPLAADLYSVLETMNNLLEGDYTDTGSGNIVIPTVGTFSTLDDAVDALRQEIDNEADNLYDQIKASIDGYDGSSLITASAILTSDNSTIDSIFELWNALTELESLYEYVIKFLERERALRKIAGIEFDEDSIRVENFVSDGSTTAFPLSRVPSEPEAVSVTFNRVNMLYGIDYVIQTSGDSVLEETTLLIFTAPPDTLVTTLDGNGIIQVRYNVKGAIEVDNDPLGISTFISQLEEFSNDTGEYGIANILDKMATPDQEGELFKSYMKQSRNKALAQDIFGIECKGLNRVGFDESQTNIVNYFEFIDSYGYDQNSLSESYVYSQTNFTKDQYYAARLTALDSIDKTLIKQQICANVITQYLFIDDIEMIMTEEMYLAYELDLKNPGISRKVKLYKEEATTGYPIGLSDDLMYLIGRIEGSLPENPNFKVRQGTLDYLEEQELDLTRLVKVCQAQLISDISGVFNIHPSDTIAYFKRPSIVRSLQDRYKERFIPPYSDISGTVE